MNERDFDIWAAGFFDGEGCIRIARGPARTSADYQYSLQVTVNQRVRAPLDALKDRYGGSIHDHGANHFSQREILTWQVTSLKAAAALRAMLPYLRVKAEQARVAIEFQERRLPRSLRRIASVVATQVERDEGDYRALQQMKRVS